MLIKLLIQNYALIESLEMNPNKGLTIITGETGAGKSIMLGAVGLLLGKRADTKSLLNEDKKCIIEGVFNIESYHLSRFFEQEELDYEIETTIRREITSAGKSRAFINDTPVTLDTLKKLGHYLMDLHSQHETLQLGASAFQLNLIDIFAGTQKLKANYSRQFNAYKQLEKDFQVLKLEGERLKKEEDYNSFLLQELSELSLEEHEQDPLEEELKLLENGEEVKHKLNEVLSILDSPEHGALEHLQLGKSLLNQLTVYGNQYKRLSKSFEQAFIELKELSRDISTEEDCVVVDFERTEQVQHRLSRIFQLQKKHHVNSIKELLSIQTELEEKSIATTHLEDTLQKAALALKEAEKKALIDARLLSKQRISQLVPFKSNIEVLLVDLGIPDAQVSLQSNTTSLGSQGLDEITLYFSANKGVKPQPLKQVASGGEFSRLMFCIKYLLANKTALPTIVFDEIDTGISGEIALKMGTMMRKMAQSHQVIAISHLPQIAAKGDAHYFVYKDNSSTRAISSIKALTTEQSMEEIAKMIGGASPSQSAYANARELMKL